jgi:hypothetical protein
MDRTGILVSATFPSRHSAMLEKSGGFAALIDRGVVTQCSLCDKDNPDLENRGYCSACGALFRDKMRRRLTIVKAAALLGVALTLLGAALSLGMDLRWAGLAVFLLGIVPLAFGILANRQLADFLLQALSLRAAADTQRSLRTTNRVAAGLLLYFLTAFGGCIPYYLYVERPRQQLEAYQARFADKLAEYTSLVPDDVTPAAEAKPYLAGKAVVVEKTPEGPRVSEVHVALPPAVRAETPEEVGTVAVVEWKDFRTGEYKYGEKPTGILAFRVDGDVRIINLANKSLLAREVFTGSDAPTQPPRDGSHGRGARPIAKIALYVGGLDSHVPPTANSSPASTSQESSANGDRSLSKQEKPKPEPKSADN